MRTNVQVSLASSCGPCVCARAGARARARVCARAFVFVCVCVCVCVLTTKHAHAHAHAHAYAQAHTSKRASPAAAASTKAAELAEALSQCPPHPHLAPHCPTRFLSHRKKKNLIQKQVFSAINDPLPPPTLSQDRSVTWLERAVVLTVAVQKKKRRKQKLIPTLAYEHKDTHVGV
jgi:hypothetical protein